MRIYISGSGGFIGGHLVDHLRAGGHEVVRMLRSRPEPGEYAIEWHPESGQLNPADLEGADAIINLSGESIAGRWTEARKQAIRDSRVNGTRLISETIAKLERRPRALINASAIGIYGDRGDEPLDESSPPGRGFLADVCKEWEAATEPASRAGVRVVCARFGVVLDPDGGALAKMLPFFKSGLGGPVGSGHQYISWISLDDITAAMEFFLTHEKMSGAVNVVAPNPVAQAEFARELGAAIKRPAVVPTPAWTLKMMFGEMATETILASARVFPQRLLKGGFEFLDPDVETAFERMFQPNPS